MTEYDIFVSYVRMYDKEKQIIMSILKLILTAVFAVSTIIPAFAQTEPERKDNEVVWTETDGVTIPLPPKAHPRLYLRDANVPELREKMKTPEGKAILKKSKKPPGPARPRKKLR